MVLTITISVVVLTLLVSMVLLGRFTLMVVGLSTFFGTIVIVQRDMIEGWIAVVLLAVALTLIVVGRPSMLRAGHARRISRQRV